MAELEGKHFSITDPKDVSTVIYQIFRTPKEFLADSPKYTLERLPYAEELRGENKRKTFFVDDPIGNGNQLVILSFGRERVVVNMGILEDEKIRISKKPMPLKFDSLYPEDVAVYKEFKYTPNLKRPISILDPETTEEVKPVLYYDEETEEIKGKYKLKPNKSYFAFEIRENKGNN